MRKELLAMATLCVIMVSGCASVNRGLDAMGIHMSPVNVGVSLSGGGVTFCQQHGYTSYPYTVVHNKSSFPGVVTINGEPVPMVCNDGRVYLQIPPGAEYKIYTEETTATIGFQVLDMTMAVQWATKMSNYYMWGFGYNYGYSNLSNGYMLGAQVGEVTDQMFLNDSNYIERYKVLLEAKKRGENPVPLIKGMVNRSNEWSSAASEGGKKLNPPHIRLQKAGQPDASKPSAKYVATQTGDGVTQDTASVKGATATKEKKKPKWTE